MFGNRKLKAWLSEDYNALKKSIKNDIAAHVRKLKLSNKDLYAYAILPGTSYEITSLSAVSNQIKNIKEDTPYYKYCVDEWATWEHDAFSNTNTELKNCNADFQNLHKPKGESCYLDKYETRHINNILNVILLALQELYNEGEFIVNEKALFIIIWLSDDEHPIVLDSLNKLNSKDAIESFLSEFG